MNEPYWTDQVRKLKRLKRSYEQRGQVERERNELLEGLKWYADERNYAANDKRPLTPVEKDMGSFARSIVAKIEGRINNSNG